MQIWGAEEENKLLEEEERRARMHSNGVDNPNSNNNATADETNLYFPPLQTIGNSSRDRKVVSLSNAA